MILAAVLVLLVIGSLLFHFLTPWYFTPIASNWGTIDDTIDITFWITGFVFVVVNLFVAYCLVRFRTRKGRRAAYEPENKKLEWWLTGVTTVGVASMLAPGLFVWANFVKVPADASVFEAVGQQWHWRYRFPGKRRGTRYHRCPAHQREEPVRIESGGPQGQRRRADLEPGTASAGGPAFKAELRSIDVLHNFAVPQFRAKMDLIPGSVTFVWFTPTREGRFDLLCNELCGVAHYAMRGKVVVEDEQTFQAWLRGYPTFAETMARAPGDVVVGRQLYATCAACHGAQGEGNRQLNAPKLAGPRGLVHAPPAEVLQGRRAGNAPAGHLRQAHGTDGGHAGRRCRHRQCQRLYRVAAGQAGPAYRQRQCRTMVAGCSCPPAVPATGPKGRGRRRRMRRGLPE